MKYFLSLVFTFYCITTIAQTKELTLEDAVLKGRSTLAPSRLVGLNWIPNSNTYFYYAKNKIVLTNADTRKEDTLDVLKGLNKTFTDKPLNTIPFIEWVDESNFTFTTNNKVYNYNTTELNTTLLNSYNENAENVDVHKGDYNIAFTIKSDLYVSIKNIERKIASSEKNGIVYGQAVHRNEFGIETGTFWSPKGNKLAYYRMDQSMVSEYPIYDLQKQPATVNTIRYPMAGDTSHEVSVMVYDLNTNKSITLKVDGPKDQYLTNVSWSPDEKYIYIQVLNRDQNDMNLNQYDAINGSFIKTLFNEKNTYTYVEPLHPIVFTPDGKNFIYQSPRSGYNSCYLYDLNGKEILKCADRLITTNFYGFDGTGKYIFLQVVRIDNITKFTIKSSLSDGNYDVIGNELISCTSIINTAGNYVINNMSSINTPRVYDLINVSKNESSTIYKADNPLKEFNIGKNEIKKLVAKDGNYLFSRIIYPYDFDATKKYPMLVYVYGGPHVQLVTNTWLNGAELWMHYMANRGFIVFTVDSRGSDNRGAAFETATFRQLGTMEISDQMDAVNFMKTQSYIDSNRIGVHGWSFGGFMTTSLMTREPNTFKVGVAGGPVIDWSYYEVMYTERYMDTPQQNPEGYKNSSLFNYINNLKGKLMLIHGTSDDVVVWQHSLLYIQRCIEAGKQIDYFVYPGHPHNVIGKDRVHLMKKVTDYFIDNL